MQCFVRWIKPIEFIGKCGDGPIPPANVTWDNATPWDNTTYWS